MKQQLIPVLQRNGSISKSPGRKIQQKRKGQASVEKNV